MAKDELVDGFKDYSGPEEVNTEEGDDTPGSTPWCATAASVITIEIDC
ncbi:hypothetical protein ABFT23_11115 [Nocardioides sp. C4-1]